MFKHFIPASSFRGRGAAFLLFALLACGPARAEEKVSLDFVDTDIAAVAKAVGYISQRNFILDPRIKGTINIVSTHPVPKSQIYDVFLSALRTQGYTVVEGRGAYKIVPAADAKTNYSQTVGKAVGRGNDTLMTQVYPLQFADSAQILPVLRPLVSANNVVSALAGGNALVITEYADNLKRLDRLIEAMDQPSGQDSGVIRLQHAVAADVASALQRLLGEAKDEPPSQRVYMVPDPRTNSILVRCNNPSRLVRVRELIGQMDGADGRTAAPRVIFLRNADAASLVRTLRGSMGTGSAGGVEAAASVSTSTSSLAGLAAPVAATAATTTTSVTASAANGQLQILADTSVNAIILVGPAVLQAQYQQVIEQLDTRPAEVFIEALIVEMAADRAHEFGIQWQTLNGVDGGSSRVVGGTNFGTKGSNILSASQNLTGVSQGINLGVMDGQVSIPINGTPVQILNLKMLAHALETQSGTHILSAPNLLTLDNHEAEIMVGQNVPFVTGQYTVSSTSNTTSPFQTIERQDVGLKLRVKPQIGDDGNIRLRLYQEVSSIRSTSDVNGPTTNKRSIDTSVMVDDRHIVVLGGLMQDTFENGVDKVPVLGDIPVVGQLFQSRARSQAKTNLFVFLRPVVVRSRKGLDDLSQGRYGYARDRFNDSAGQAGMARERQPVPQLWLEAGEEAAK